jgi:hypothetical protein
MNDHELFGPDDEYEEADENTSMALVSTIEPYSLSVTEIDDDRIPDGMVCMGSFIGERLIARSAVPPDVIADVLSREAFVEPVRLALAAFEQNPGIQCRLFALLPAEQFRETEDEPEEPWRASIPSFEEEQEAEELPLEMADQDGKPVVPLLLGHVVRFDKDRKHPEDLAREAADVLQAILAPGTPLSSVVDKVLEELLNDGGPGDAPPDVTPSTDEE